MANHHGETPATHFFPAGTDLSRPETDLSAKIQLVPAPDTDLSDRNIDLSDQNIDLSDQNIDLSDRNIDLKESFARSPVSCALTLYALTNLTRLHSWINSPRLLIHESQTLHAGRLPDRFH